MENDTKPDGRIQVDEVNDNINVEKTQGIETQEQSTPVLEKDLTPTDNINETIENSTQGQVINNNINNTEDDVEKIDTNASALMIDNNIDDKDAEKSTKIPETPEISLPQPTALTDDSEQIALQSTLFGDAENTASQESQSESLVNGENLMENPENGFNSSELKVSSASEKIVEIDEEKVVKISHIEEQISPDPICDDKKIDSDTKLVNNPEIQGTAIQKPENIYNLDDDLKRLVKQYATNLGLQDVTLDVNPGTDLGDNFMGYIGKLTIKGKKLQNSEETVMNWIIKTAPNNALYRTILNVIRLYAREAYIYEHVFPIFKNFQLEKKVLKPFQEYPQLIFTTLEPMKESIIMEDMKSFGYSMTNRQEPLSLNHIKLVMKTYAKFHAISYALRDQKPDVFKTLTDNVEDILKNTLNDMAYKTQGPMLMSALESLDPVKDSRAIIKFKKFTEKFVEIAKTALDKVNNYSVISHGDSWTNNILWKYEDPNQPTIPTKVCLLDWQVARYGSPALDLSYFLFTCTDKEFRDRYYDDMIRLYYYTLCNHLNALGSDPDVLLPYDVLQKELKEFSVVGMYLTVFILFICTRETDEMAEWRTDDIKADDVADKWATKSVNANKYQRRVRDVIVDVFEKGYLDIIM